MDSMPSSGDAVPFSTDSKDSLSLEPSKNELDDFAATSVPNSLQDDKKSVNLIDSGVPQVDDEANKEDSAVESGSSGEESSSSDDSSSSEETDSSSSDSEDEVDSDGKGDESSQEDAVVESDGEQEVAGGPVMSKNESEMLPPVPKLEVSLEQHHETKPLGTILSIVGNKVIVEGSADHKALAEASVLWITETRIPLGFIDEIFGPVKNPYYVVRYNSDKDVPAGIGKGTAISFVEEFANYILEKAISRKGYDASGENDEEINDEFEFSDDEKEAEYRKAQKESKRGSNNRKRGNQEKEIYRDNKNRKGRFQTYPTFKQEMPHLAPGFLRNCDYSRGSSSPTVVPHNGGSYPLITASAQTPICVGGLNNNFNQPFQSPNALSPLGMLSMQQSNGMIPYGMQFPQQQVQQQFNVVQAVAFPAMQHPNFICEPQLPFMRPPFSAGYQANGLTSQQPGDQFLADYRRLPEQQSSPNFSSPVGFSHEASSWSSLHGAGRGVPLSRNAQNFSQHEGAPRPMQFIPGSSHWDNPCNKRAGGHTH